MFGPITKSLLSAATTGSGTVSAADTHGRKYHTIYIVGSAGVSAGAVQLETAPSEDYAGTWAALGSPVTVVASATVIAQATGAFQAIRARISTTVANGTVSVSYVGT